MIWLRRWTWRALFWYLVSLTPPCQGMNPVSDPNRWTHFTVQNGLPNNRIRQVLEDADGSLLVVTMDAGIFRYDGVQFLPLPINQLLPTLFIQWVIQDAKDRLWIACNYEGIWIYDHGKLDPFTQNSLFNQQHFVKLFKDQQGQIWIDVNRVGLFCWDGQTCVNMTRKYHLPIDDLAQIAQKDRQTYLLLFTNWQLYEFAPFQPAPLRLFLTGTFQIDAFLWIDPTKFKLPATDQNIVVSRTEPHLLLLNDVYLEPGRGAFLVEADSQTIWFYANQQFNGYHANQKQSYFIGRTGSYFPFQDRFQNLWFTSEIGLFKYDNIRTKNWPFPKKETGKYKKPGTDADNKFMFRDQAGVLWFTDYDGQLLNFDGNQVAAFPFPDSLKSILVTKMIQDQHGKYWLGTYLDGILNWDGNHFQRVISRQAVPGNYVTSLVIDSRAQLWIGSTSALTHFSGFKTSELSFAPESGQENPHPPPKVTSFTVDAQETVWLGTRNQTLFYSAGNQFKKIETTFPTANRYYNVQNLFSHENQLWGTSNYGIFNFEAKTRTTQFYQPPTYPTAITVPPLSEHFNWLTGDFYHLNSIYCLKAYANFKPDFAPPIYNIAATGKDPAGGVWIGSYSVGLFYLTPDTLIRFDSQHGMPSLKISAIYRDQENRLWIGTLDHGLFLKQGQRFIQTAAMKCIGRTIYTLLEDRQHRLWIGTLDHGLILSAGHRFQVDRNYLPQRSIWGIGESPTGTIYAVLEDASFARINGNHFKLLPRAALLSDADLRQAFINKTINFRKYFREPEQFISPGLVCRDGVQLKHYTVAQGLPGHEISDLTETADGKLWVATLNTGVAYQVGTHFQPLIHPELKQLSRFMTFQANRDSSLWILSEEGIAYRKGDSIQVWGRNSKIVGYHALDLELTRNQQLVFSDENNLYYFNQGDIQKLPYFFMSESNNPGIMPFFYIDSLNQAWFVTNQRQLIALPLNRQPPIIRIKNCQIGDHLYNESQILDPIVTGYAEHACAIEFFGYHSDFAASQIQYAFRTSKAGKTSAWSPFSTRNRILYSSLESGQSHRFEIQARTPDGLISDATASLQIILRQKPFYLQSWFYWSIFSWILMLIAGYFMYRYSWIKKVLNQRRFNPYIAGEPILNSELFFGRKEIIDHILAILPNNNIMITGERRIGKTSLLMQIKQQIQTHPKPPVSFIPIFVDLQGVEQWEFFRALTHDILEQIGDSIVSLPLKIHHVSTDYGYRDFNSDFRKILNHVSARQSRPVKLVLLIDEADAMNEYDQIIHAQLRRIFMQDFSLNFGAIIAGTHYIQSWNRPESPWWNLFTMIGLQAFSEPDAQQLIQAPVKGIFKYTPEAIAEILNQTEAKPYAIQTLCLNLVARAFDRGRRKIERADVLAVVESLNWEMKQVT